MSIVIGLNLAAHPASPPSRSEHPLIQKLIARRLEQSLVEDLKLTKDYEEFLSENIKLFESFLNDRMLSPSVAMSTRYRLIFFGERLRSLKKRQGELETWFEQRRQHPDSPPTWEVLDRLDRLEKEWETWEQAWDAGHIAPMPREVKR